MLAHLRKNVHIAVNVGTKIQRMSGNSTEDPLLGGIRFTPKSFTAQIPPPIFKIQNSNMIGWLKKKFFFGHIGLV